MEIAILHEHTIRLNWLRNNINRIETVLESLPVEIRNSPLIVSTTIVDFFGCTTRVKYIYLDELIRNGRVSISEVSNVVNALNRQQRLRD